MHELLVAMDIADEAEYAAYRRGMMPILHRMGGRFGNDFRVAEALRTEAAHPVNRVFTIRFPDRATKEAFYAHPDYLAVKDRHFAKAVRSRTILAEYTQT